MFQLQNDSLLLRLDDSGRLLRLEHRAAGKNYVGAFPLWRIIYQDGISMEEELLPEECAIEILETSSDRIEMAYRSDRGFRVTIHVRMTEDTFRFDADLENASSALVLREFQFPMVKSLNLSAETLLRWSPSGGMVEHDLPATIERCHTQYVAQDNKAIEFGTMYPGLGATVNCFLLDDGDHGLYFGSHDETFQFTYHLFRKLGPSLDATFVKYPYLPPGAKTSLCGFVLAPYAGDWHRGVSFYRAFAERVFAKPEVPESIRNSNGWHRIILRHQYGKVLFRVDQLPEILRDGLAVGIDTLFLFGWWDKGMDAGYPEYHFDESQGGFDALRDQIRAFQKGGGNVILYFNGQLIDTETDYYRTTGHRISVKRPNGTEHGEVYPFGGDGTALRVFGNKTFVTACPSCPEWSEQLKTLIDRAIELEADGVFFDQLGFISRPCFDPSHGHPVPHMQIMRDKAEMVRELRAYLKAKRPSMSFGVEWPTDLIFQHVDFVHSIVGPRHMNFLHYLFPDAVFTDRCIRDDSHPEDPLNLAVIRGLRSDVEIYRCRATISETPRYQEHMKRVNRLRDRYRDLILNGSFQEIEGVVCETPGIEYGVFRNGSRLAVVLAPDGTDTPASSVEVSVPHARFLSADSTHDAARNLFRDERRVRFSPAPHELTVLEFEFEPKRNPKG